MITSNHNLDLGTDMADARTQAPLASLIVKHVTTTNQRQRSMCYMYTHMHTRVHSQIVHAD